ncbi:MAG: hypothetical protein ACRD1R_03870, partial [Acidobacteriota bacterium]
AVASPSSSRLAGRLHFPGARPLRTFTTGCLPLEQEQTIRNLRGLGWTEVNEDRDFCLLQSLETPPFLLLVTCEGQVVPMKPTLGYG